MTRCGTGLATSPTAVAAAEQAVADAIAGAGGHPGLLCVFVRDDDPAAVAVALRAAAAMAPSAVAVGCGVAGLSAPGMEVRSGPAAAAWAATIPGATARVFHLETIRTGERLAVLGQPPTDDESAVMLLLADAWTFPIDGFVAGVNAAWPGLPVVGGLADGAAPGEVRLLHGSSVADRGAVGLLLTGSVGIEAVSAQGCRPVGQPLTVTDADGSLIRTIAGRPAPEVLAASLLGEPPAGVRIGIAREELQESHGFGDYAVRDLVAIEEGGIRIADVVAVGSTVQFQVPDPDAADADLASLLWEVRHRPWVDRIAGALVIGGTDRGRPFFADPGHDATVVAEQFDCPAVIGIATTAEVAPVAGRNHLHAVSAAVLAVTAAG